MVGNARELQQNLLGFCVRPFELQRYPGLILSMGNAHLEISIHNVCRMGHRGHGLTQVLFMQRTSYKELGGAGGHGVFPQTKLFIIELHPHGREQTPKLIGFCIATRPFEQVCWQAYLFKQCL